MTDKKPCINCGEECDIYAVQLGDFATLSYLRLCNAECLFAIAHEFLYELYEHKNFRNKLYEMQNIEDKDLRDNHQKERMDYALEEMRKHFESSPNLLTTPAPQSITDAFKERKSIPYSSGTTMRFTRTSYEDRVKYSLRYLEDCQDKFNKAKIDYEELLQNKS